MFEKDQCEEVDNFEKKNCFVFAESEIACLEFFWFLCSLVRKCFSRAANSESVGLWNTNIEKKFFSWQTLSNWNIDKVETIENTVFEKVTKVKKKLVLAIYNVLSEMSAQEIDVYNRV